MPTLDGKFNADIDSDFVKIILDSGEECEVL